MNIVFWFMIIAIAFVLYLLLLPLSNIIGQGVINIGRAIKKAFTDNGEKDKTSK